VRALVVDDNETNRLILRQILSTRGAAVDEAAGGPQALAKLESATSVGKPFRLVLLDCRMPGMDGFQTAERIRAGDHRGLTILMLTSDGLKLNVARTTELGLDGYLVKPIRRAILLETIANAMTRGVSSAPSSNSSDRSEEGAASTVPGPQQGKLQILLADDSDDNRLLLRVFLGSDFHLEEVEHGAAAVERFKASHYDLVVMDVQMPVMDGLEAIREIREFERTSGSGRTPIIALTASVLEADVHRSHEAGADVHVSKPVKKETLLRAIRTATNSPPFDAAVSSRG
jgi:CheY-like chemotaxis protein